MYMYQVINVERNIKYTSCIVTLMILGQNSVLYMMCAPLSGPAFVRDYVSKLIHIHSYECKVQCASAITTFIMFIFSQGTILLSVIFLRLPLYNPKLSSDITWHSSSILCPDGECLVSVFYLCFCFNKKLHVLIKNTKILNAIMFNYFPFQISV